jgi:EpsD family peptidyl-prolyl cis-trans isomerase
MAVLAGCGEGGEKKATQVAAKVNKDEITVHQLNFAMQRLGANIPEAQLKPAQKQVLDRLVDQQLLVQKAIEEKLDRDPQVVQSIEASRRQILAQAYVQRVAGAAQKASSDTVKGFYDEHPELFKERRVYRFAQMAIAAPADEQPQVRARLEELDKQADKTKILPQLAAWLKAENLQFRASQVTQAAEQLPMEALPRYHKMAVGDLIVSPGAQGIVVAQLIAAQSVPLTQEQATPFIEQYLQNRERLKLSDDEMKRLRTAAKIEYVGEFAKLGQTQPAQAESAAPPTAEAGRTPDDEAISKGLKSLK